MSGDGMSGFSFALPGRVIFGRGQAQNAPAMIRVCAMRMVRFRLPPRRLKAGPKRMGELRSGGCGALR